MMGTSQPCEEASEYWGPPYRPACASQTNSSPGLRVRRPIRTAPGPSPPPPDEGFRALQVRADGCWPSREGGGA
eukprot:6727172-Alexandrium_andersonii.AAC.1